MKNILSVLSLLIWGYTSAQSYTADILFKNGKIIDGTGNPWFYGDVAVKGNKIVAVGVLNDWTALKIIDVQHKIIAPGFIDIHTHIEGDEVQQPTADNFIFDGVTTVITGNCGSSEPDLKKYFIFIDSLRLSVNVASLIGHNDVRRMVMGNANRIPSSDEMQQMKNLVEQAMKAGAVGFSTGLIYAPGTYAKTDEIVALAKVAAQYHGIYASHIRDEADGVTEAVKEAINIGKEANIPVEISHFKISGQHNWGRSKETLPLVINARSKGLDVTIDQYPYTASSTSLSTLLPDYILEGDKDSITIRLNNPAIQNDAITYILNRLKKRKLKHLSYTVVANYSANTNYNGKSIEKINLLMGRKHTARDEAMTVIEMMKNGGASMIFHGMSEDDVKYIMRYPFNMFASDASIRVYGKGMPHPRGYGTNARVLGKYVREEKVLTLEDAIRRMTSLPAQKFRIRDRGLVRENYVADIVVFDENTVRDLSTFDKPHQYSTGFYYVLVNGKITIDNTKHTGGKNGIILYGMGKR